MEQLLQELKELVLKIETQVSLEKQASYDAGFAAGVASVNGSDDKIYSQAEYDQKLAEALSAIQQELAAVKVELDVVKAGLQKAQEVATKYVAFIDAEIEDAKVDSTRLEAFKASLGE